MPGKHRLYMHCPGLSEDHLYTYLQQFGRVTDIYLPKALDGQSKGYGFASFESADALSAALGAGDEHIIRGKTVRVNRAGPRPALHLPTATEPGRSQSTPPTSTVPLTGGVSRQRGGHSSVEASSSSSALPGLGPGSDTKVHPGVVADGGAVRSSVPQGAGPRIYVGGIPNAVSETMVRKYFSKWGKVEDVYFPKERATGRRRPFCFVTFASQKAAEKAVAQSNREISGYQVASISMTADRIAHYQQVSGGGEELQRMFQDIEPAHPFALSLQGLLPQLASAQAQQANLSALGAQNLMLSHQQGLPTLGGNNPMGPLTGLGGEVNFSLDDASLHPSAFALSQQQLSQQQLSQQQQQLAQQQLGQQPFAEQALGRQALGHAQYVQRSANQQPSQLAAAPHQDLPFLEAGLMQPHMQEALLSGDMARAANMHNPTEFPSNLHGLSSAQYAQLNHQRLLQQQALSHQPGHQATAVQHPQPGQPFGPMLNYSSNHLNGTSAFLLPSGPAQRSVELAQRLGQGNSTQPPLQLQAQPRSQDFNPTVGARPPDQSGNNFGEAPSVMQIPLMEPYLIAQIPDLPRADSYGPRRRTLLPHNARHGPY